MKTYCKNCEQEVTPYVTPHEAHWKLECPLCDADLGIMKDDQPDDEFMAYVLARRSPRNQREEDYLKNKTYQHPNKN